MLYTVEDFKKLDFAFNRLSSKERFFNDKKYIISKKISKMSNNGTKPTHFIFRLIEADISTDTSRFIKSKMKSLVEKEVMVNDYESNKLALKEIYEYLVKNKIF